VNGAETMIGRYLEDLAVGAAETLSRLVNAEDIEAFAAVTGDNNPVHLDAEYAATTAFGERIAHGMLSAGYISAVLGTRLPGPGAIYLSQTLSFKRPVKIGDTVETTCTVTAIDPVKARVTIACVCKVAGKTVVEGEAVVMAPRRP
jgi:3-hydroxybutyryl-CoA dehydratase